MKHLTFTLQEHVVIGNTLKLLRNEVSHRYIELANELGKTNSLVNRFKKAVDGLDAVKGLMDDILFHDHPQASDDYLKAYYGRYPKKFPDDLNEMKKIINPKGSKV